MEEEISLIELFGILKKRLGMIVGLSLLGLISSFLVTFFLLTPEYNSTAKVLIRDGQTGEAVNDIIKSSDILTAVQKELNLELTQEELSNKVEVHQSEGNIYNIVATSEDPNEAVEIANTITEVFQKNVDDIMEITIISPEEIKDILGKVDTVLEKTEELGETAELSAGKVLEAVEAAIIPKQTVQILSEANINASPNTPNMKLNLAIGLILGLMAGGGAAFTLDLLDQNVKDDRFITEELHWSNLGEVIDVETKKLKKYTSGDLKSIVPEQLQGIRTNIQFLIDNQKLESLVITSARPKVGKSMLAVDLAKIFATQDQKVLLVDADLRSSALHESFGVSNNIGLTTILTEDDKELDEMVRTTDTEGLYILTAGPESTNPMDLLMSKRMSSLGKEIKEMFDLVIYHTPAILPIADARVLASKVDGTVFVVPQDRVTEEDVLKSKELLKMAKANVIGAVMIRSK